MPIDLGVNRFGVLSEPRDVLRVVIVEDGLKLRLDVADAPFKNARPKGFVAAKLADQVRHAARRRDAADEEEERNLTIAELAVVHGADPLGPAQAHEEAGQVAPAPKAVVLPGELREIRNHDVPADGARQHVRSAVSAFNVSLKHVDNHLCGHLVVGV